MRSVYSYNYTIYVCAYNMCMPFLIQFQQVPMASAQHLHQEAVKLKLRRFHSGLEHLQVYMCITCCESFPDMTVRTTSSGSECVGCSRDRHRYSCENNMHPGPVPQELKVFC